MKNLFFPQSMIRKVVLIAFLFITSAIFYTQNKIYASSQTNQPNGLCIACSVSNPQFAVGNNENDFATINMPLVALGGKIVQTLIFPTPTKRHFKKIVIGIGKPGGISIQALGEIRVESYLGNTANGDNIQVDSSMLKIGQDPQKATIEFTPTKFFDHIQISFIGGLITLNDKIQIYYAYHTPTKFTDCGNPPLDPLHYYSFDGNANDIISDYNLSADSSTIFQNDGFVCGGNVYGYNNAAILNNTNAYNDSIKTIAFWMKMDNLPLNTDGNSEVSIASNYAFTINANKIRKVISVKFHDERLFPIEVKTPIEVDELAHITVVHNEEQKITCLYKNGSPFFNNCKGMPTPIPLYIRKLFLQRAKIDELLMYDRVLTEDEIKALACSYGKLPNCTSGTSAPASKIAVPTETFTVSPNPTTGQITLDGNILLVGSDISIRNTSGTEVYHTAFKSKTFELPATLPGGVYMLTLQTKDKKVYTRKIILSR